MHALPWLPSWLPQVGRFWAVAAPWVRLGFNVLPILPGSKAPAIKGWGQWHSPDSPRIPQEVLAQWCAQFREYNAAVLYGSGDAMCIDIDDPRRLDTVLEICGPTPFRVYSGREGGGVHLLYSGAGRSRNRICAGVDLKSTGAYAIAPGSIHAKTGNEYTASLELVAALVGALS